MDMEAAGEGNGDFEGDENLLPEERRKANKQIEKNFLMESKGKRKKTPRIAKVSVVSQLAFGRSNLNFIQRFRHI